MKKIIDKCSICKRINDSDSMTSTDWRTHIIITDKMKHIPDKELSICPRCRRLYSIEYLYMIII